MAGMEERVRATTDAIDALGNTTAATGKGFAIGSAVLTALSLLTAFTEKAEIGNVHIGEPVVLSGVIIGSMLPFLFAALTMLSVQKVREICGKQSTSPSSIFCLVTQGFALHNFIGCFGYHCRSSPAIQRNARSQRRNSRS